MVNIYEILKKNGIEIPPENVSAFEKEFFENYKTVKEVGNIQTKLSNAETQIKTWEEKYNNDIRSRDNDLADLKNKLEQSNNNDSDNVVADLKNQIENLTSTYSTEKADYEKKLKRQQYEFLVKEQINGLRFTSESAKRAFTSDILAKELPVENEKLLGFDDYLANYKEQDSGAFVNEQDVPTAMPKFVSKSSKMEQTDAGVAQSKPRPRVW